MWKRIRDAYKALKGQPEIKEVYVYKTIPYDVIRHQLGSIDPQMVRYLKSMNEEEYLNHLSNINKIVRNDSFMTELNGMLDAQVYFMGEKAKDGELAFSRGTVNGICLVIDRFESLSGEYLEKTKERPPINPTDILPEQN